MVSKSLILFFAFAVALATAASIEKEETKKSSRPEEPLYQECEEPGENRENCFIQDPANYENYMTYLEDVANWEKENPAEAAEFNNKNPDVKKQEQARLAELEKIAKVHE